MKVMRKVLGWKKKAKGGYMELQIGHKVYWIMLTRDGGARMITYDEYREAKEKQTPVDDIHMCLPTNDRACPLFAFIREP